MPTSEKACEAVHPGMPHKEASWTVLAPICTRVAAALEAAGQERDREWQRRGHHDDKCFYATGPAQSIAVTEQRARAEAFEEAAGIVRRVRESVEEIAAANGWNRDEVIHSLDDATVQIRAAAIRARAKEGSGK